MVDTYAHSKTFKDLLPLFRMGPIDYISSRLGGRHKTLTHALYDPYQPPEIEDGDARYREWR